MRKHWLAIVAVLLLSGVACKEDEDTISYEYYIEGLVNNRPLKYSQFNIPGTNVSNTYFPEFQEAWFQAYRDSLNLEDGFWQVRIHDLDINSIKTPYRIQDGQGTVSWFDPRLDDSIANNPNCQGIDAGCVFFLQAGKDENSMTITSVRNNIIEGHFSGKMSLISTGFSSHEDSLSSYTVKKGQFRIKYRTE